MDKTFYFGFFKIIASTIYFCISGISMAKRNHLTAFKGLIYYSFAMGLESLFHGIYYLYPSFKVSPLLLSLTYAIIPFIYLTFFIVIYQYALPGTIKDNRFIKYLFIVPIITFILSLTYKYHNIFIIYGDDFYHQPFREIRHSFGFWGYVYYIYQFFISILTFGILIYTLHKLNKQNEKTKTIIILIFFTVFLALIPEFLVFDFVCYIDLIFNVSNVVFVYITFHYDDAEQIIFQGQIKLIESFPFPVIFNNNNDKIVYANKEAIKVCPKIYDFILKDYHYKEFYDCFSLFCLSDEDDNNDEKNYKGKIVLKKNGTNFLYFLQSQNILYRNRFVIGKMHMFITVSSIQHFVGELKTMAMQDKLCGFYNRYYLEAKKSEIENNYDILPITILMCDLDNLKKVNDTLGHELGDEYILHCCSVIRKFTKKEDLLFRLGGDEFLIILLNTSLKEGEKIAKSITDNVHFTKLKEYQTGISIGCASSESSFNDFDELLNAADENMYCIKKQHKHRTEI